jgi:hypothetical protein
MLENKVHSVNHIKPPLANEMRTFHTDRFMCLLSAQEPLYF